MGIHGLCVRRVQRVRWSFIDEKSIKEKRRRPPFYKLTSSRNLKTAGITKQISTYKQNQHDKVKLEQKCGERGSMDSRRMVLLNLFKNTHLPLRNMVPKNTF